MEKATYSLSALKQCKKLIRKNRWSTRLKAEHNSRCAEVNVLFASCQKLLNYVMFQPDLSPAYDYQQMVLSKSCTKNNSTISFVFATRATITAAIGAVSSYRSNLANWENTDKHTLHLCFMWRQSFA